MAPSCADIEEAVVSGSADRVNTLIDELEDLDSGDRIALFDACFAECRELYRTVDDGYQRQAVVRILNTLNPSLALAAFVTGNDEGFPTEVTQSELLEAVTQLEEFLLTAIQDDDGRVRRAAKRALKQVCIGYDMTDNHDAIEGLVDELEALQATCDDEEIVTHMREAQEQAGFYLQSPATRLLDGLAEELNDSAE